MKLLLQRIESRGYREQSAAMFEHKQRKYLTRQTSHRITKNGGEFRCNYINYQR